MRVSVCECVCICECVCVCVCECMCVCVCVGRGGGRRSGGFAQAPPPPIRALTASHTTLEIIPCRLPSVLGGRLIRLLKTQKSHPGSKRGHAPC